MLHLSGPDRLSAPVNSSVRVEAGGGTQVLLDDKEPGANRQGVRLSQLLLSLKRSGTSRELKQRWVAHIRLTLRWSPPLNGPLYHVGG